MKDAWARRAHTRGRLTTSGKGGKWGSIVEKAGHPAVLRPLQAATERHCVACIYRGVENNRR